MSKRIFFICLWTLIFIFGSTLLQIVVARSYIAVTGSKPGVITTILEGFCFIFGTLALGITGLILGVRGHLPGTRKKIL
jgi:hypothetical protein